MPNFGMQAGRQRAEGGEVVDARGSRTKWDKTHALSLAASSQSRSSNLPISPNPPACGQRCLSSRILRNHHHGQTSMSAQRRQKRIPISCEPCRLRKIRCSRPRGPPPCETCVRRNLASRCQYADRHQVLSPAPQHALPSPISERSASNPSNSLSNEDLAARVANLEALIHGQAGGLQLPPTRPVQPVSRIKGMLSTSEMGHVRFIPCTTSSGSTRSVADPQQATSQSIDLSAGPYPLGKRHVEVQHLFVDLPSRGHCKHLKEVYFESFAPVCLTRLQTIWTC